MSKHKHSLLRYQDDFDFWRRLAENDPQQFEEIRERFFREFIASQPSDKQSQLHRVQWRVEQTRRLSKNPIDAMNRLSKMMWDELIVLNGHHKELVATFLGDRGGNSVKPKRSATVLSIEKYLQSKD